MAVNASSRRSTAGSERSRARLRRSRSSRYRAASASTSRARTRPRNPRSTRTARWVELAFRREPAGPLVTPDAVVQRVVGKISVAEACAAWDSTGRYPPEPARDCARRRSRAHCRSSVRSPVTSRRQLAFDAADAGPSITCMRSARLLKTTTFRIWSLSVARTSIVSVSMNFCLPESRVWSIRSIGSPFVNTPSTGTAQQTPAKAARALNVRPRVSHAGCKRWPAAPIGAS